MRTAINAAIIEDNKILLVRKNKTWILPGGKPEGNESDIECLCRECKEELSDTLIKDIVYYDKFQGRTPHKGDILEARVYFAKINGKLNNSSMEINGCEWTDNPYDYILSEITSKIIESLKKDGYLELKLL